MKNFLKKNRKKRTTNRLGKIQARLGFHQVRAACSVPASSAVLAGSRSVSACQRIVSALSSHWYYITFPKFCQIICQKYFIFVFRFLQVENKNAA
jgi:hypothetical protein